LISLTIRRSAVGFGHDEGFVAPHKMVAAKHLERQGCPQHDECSGVASERPVGEYMGSHQALVVAGRSANHRNVTECSLK